MTSDISTTSLTPDDIGDDDDKVDPIQVPKAKPAAQSVGAARRFDRADFRARAASTPTTAPEPAAPVAQSGQYAGDRLLVADYLLSQGWSRESIAKIFKGPEFTSIHDIANRKVAACCFPNAAATPQAAAASEEVKEGQDRPAVEEGATPNIPIFWTKASIVVDGERDPYNKELSDAQIKANKSGNGPAADTPAGIAYTAIQVAMSLTGYGAIALTIFKLLTTVLEQVLPDSVGGWEKLTPLQRKRAALYRLLPAFEEIRNQRIFKSQKLALAIGSERLNDQPLSRADPNYAKYVRNTLVRHSYAAEFYRVTQTEDDACFPVLIVNALHAEQMWPPPLPPIPLDPADYRGPDSKRPQWKYYNYDLSGLDKRILAEQHAQLTQEYLEDAAQFKRIASLVSFSPEVMAFAREFGCIPALGSPANPGNVQEQES